jgi:hypothetical protein
MILDDLFEASIPPHIRASDLPPAMRNRKLTMKDVEKERPQGAYRFRVVSNVPGESSKDFLDQRSAEEHARAVKGRVEPIVRESAKKPNPRIERILKQLRARHPQAEDDLEALIYDFRSQQGQDRKDISRLDMENDMEEADIDRLEKILINLKKQRELAENTNQRRVMRDENENIIVDEAKKDACYNKVRSRYKVWPSAYASGALVQCRKKGAANWGNKS